MKLYKLFFTNEENIAGANSEKGQLIVVTNYCDLISTLYYFYIEFSNNNGKRGGGSLSIPIPMNHNMHITLFGKKVDECLKGKHCMTCNIG